MDGIEAAPGPCRAAVTLRVRGLPRRWKAQGGGRAPQLALIGREVSFVVIVHWYIDVFNDTGTLHGLSEHDVTNYQSQLWGVHPI